VLGVILKQKNLNERRVEKHLSYKVKFKDFMFPRNRTPLGKQNTQEFTG
jgi:hypothetical protein